MADIIVSAIVIALIAFAGIRIVKQKKRGGCCGCEGCSGCANTQQCQSSKIENE